MLENQKKHTTHPIKDELSRLFFISIGVFLFVLFFQPFPLEQLDYNNRLLFVTGFGAITFLSACVTLIFLPLWIPKRFNTSEWESGPPIILNIFLLIVTTTEFAFYIRYVGKTPLSLYIMFKTVLVCLLPVIILIILYRNKSLAHFIGILQEQNNFYFSKLRDYEENGGEEEIDILSDNKSDNLTLKYKNIVLVKSADNYIEMYYLENDLVEKKLIRNTLKNIESQLANQRNLIRCHRTSIVNVVYVDKMERNYNGYSLKMSRLKEKIPVSRQYILQVKEAISANG